VRVLKKGNSNTKRLAYTSQVRPILECGASWWNPYREGQINALGRVQKNVAKFANVTNDSTWKTVSQHRKIARICAVFKAYTGERRWKATGDRLQGPCYPSMDGYDRKIRARRQRTDIGKYGFVYRAIRLWNQLHAVGLATFTCKSHMFGRRVRKVIVSEEK